MKLFKKKDKEKDKDEKDKKDKKDEKKDGKGDASPVTLTPKSSPVIKRVISVSVTVSSSEGDSGSDATRTRAENTKEQLAAKYHAVGGQRYNPLEARRLQQGGLGQPDSVPSPADGGDSHGEATGGVQRTIPMLRMAEHERLIDGRKTSRGSKWDWLQTRGIIRVYLRNQTFKTLPCDLYTTAAEMAQLAAKKFGTAEVGYIYAQLYDCGAERRLEPDECPLCLQDQWLKDVGYGDEDARQQQGRYDHSYLFRFIYSSSGSPLEHSWEQICKKLNQYAATGAGSDFHHTARPGKARPMLPQVADRLDLSNQSLGTHINRDVSLASVLLKGVIQFSLGRLSLAGNVLQSLPPELCQLPALTSLDLSNNLLSTLPDEIASLGRLEMLDLAQNQFEHVPASLCELVHLRHLVLADNRIQDLPQNTVKLTSLEFLDLRCNRISQISACVAALPALSTLDIRGNTVSFLPPGNSSLRNVLCDDNRVSVVRLSHTSVAELSLRRNGLTVFSPAAQCLSALAVIDLSRNWLTALPDSFEAMPNLRVLRLDGNRLTKLPPSVAKLSKLETLSASRNALSSLPESVGTMVGLRTLLLHANSLTHLPDDVFHLPSLCVLNAASNLIQYIPVPDPSEGSRAALAAYPPDSRPTSTEDLLAPSAFVGKRSPAVKWRNSLRSDGAWSDAEERENDAPALGKWPVLRELYLGDNNLDDECLSAVGQLTSLRVLHIGYNSLTHLQGLESLVKLHTLWAVGNDIGSVEGLAKLTALRALFVSNNKLSMVPAELSHLKQLAVLDARDNNISASVPTGYGLSSGGSVSGAGSLSSTTSSMHAGGSLGANSIASLAGVHANPPQPIVWNACPVLVHLDLTDNPRLLITSLRADFGKLTSLQLLGLEGVALPPATAQGSSSSSNPTTPTSSASASASVSAFAASSADETVDALLAKAIRRDTPVLASVPRELARYCFRSGAAEVRTIAGGGSSGVFDAVAFRDDAYRGRVREGLYALFDGHCGGGSVATFAAEKLSGTLAEELSRSTAGAEQTRRAMHRAFLGVNRKAGCAHVGKHAGASGVAVYVAGDSLCAANVGNAMAVLCRNGRAVPLSRAHVPTDAGERERIRQVGGIVTGSDRIAGTVHVSRAFGHFVHQPSVNCDAYTTAVELAGDDACVILATGSVWEVLSPQMAVDIAGSQQSPNKAAQRLRDFAWLYGARDNISVVVCYLPRATIKGRRRITLVNAVRTSGADTQEIPPPIGRVSLVFTDVVGSIALWEMCESAMRAAVREHNEVLRRLLKEHRGYEVKTEGDAFMAAFDHPMTALKWSLAVQTAMLTIDYPADMLARPECAVVKDSGGDIVYRGLRVSMGIHTGSPDCEPDPVTGRMDYFGPMVNRSARVASVAAGGQVVISLGAWQEIAASKGCETLLQSVFVKDLGSFKLKGLGKEETILLVVPSQLKARAEAAPS